MTDNEKPAAGQEPDVHLVSRRRFLSYVIGGISGVIGAALAVPLAGYFLSPIWKKNAPLLTPITRTADIPTGQPTFVTYEQRVRDGWYISTLSKGAWVVNQGNDQFVVYDPKCTHLNCPYYWDKEKQIFQCPCHGGQFDINGNVIGGPPPRPLDRLEFTIQNGSILLSGKIIGRGT
jgi:menaquinol-cytochrome c reductase iron-sulfur subunit